MSSPPRCRIGSGGVAYLAHPRWTGAGVDEVIDAPALSGIEVLNAGCELECSRGLSDDYWNALLARGRVCFELATDDSHIPGFDGGHAWTWVKAEERKRGGGHGRAAQRPLLRLARARD
jgi:hypothetical protein